MAIILQSVPPDLVVPYPQYTKIDSKNLFAIPVAQFNTIKRVFLIDGDHDEVRCAK